MVFRDVFLAGDTADHLSAVATRRTPANIVCLDDMHVVAAFGKMQSRGNASEACANNANVCGLVAP
jgi:hypothetical protein